MMWRRRTGMNKSSLYAYLTSPGMQFFVHTQLQSQDDISTTTYLGDSNYP